jgi:hypothetical protein
MPLAPLLEELTTGRDVGTVADLASHPELGQCSLFGLLSRVPQPHATDILDYDELCTGEEQA